MNINLLKNLFQKSNVKKLRSESQPPSLWESGAAFAVEHRHGHDEVLLLRIEVLHEQHGELDVVGIVLGQPAELPHDGPDVGRAQLGPALLLQPLSEGLHHLGW